MAFVALKIPMKTTEADGGSVLEDLAGRPQPGDPLFQDGTISESDHVKGFASSGIPNAARNESYFGQTNINPVDARKVFVYDTYANALAFEATGLIGSGVLQGVDLITGLPDGVGITQTAPDDFHQSEEGAGDYPRVDNNGFCNISVDDASHTEVFITSVGGRQGGPQKVLVQ
jgi:hypothetical protein